ncbi:MAG: hypothetical protein HZA17_05725 [Nitrospirae bacterium]|nr:hypothetical protein [Nitrospirota bacterium]
MLNQRTMRQSILVSLILLTMLFTALSPAQASTPIGSGKLYVFGMGLSSDPSAQTVPLNTGTAVNTNLILPNIDVGGNVPSLPADLLVVAELTGPGITNPVIPFCC